MHFHGGARTPAPSARRPHDPDGQGFVQCSAIPQDPLPREPETMNGRLSRKVAFVTGGRGGISETICSRFIEEGATRLCGGPNRFRKHLGSSAQDAARYVRLDVTSEDEASGGYVEGRCGRRSSTSSSTPRHRAREDRRAPLPRNGTGASRST